MSLCRETHCYRWNVYVPLKFIYWNLIPSVRIFGGGAFEVIRSEGEALLMGLVPFEQTLESSVILPTKWGHRICWNSQSWELWEIKVWCVSCCPWYFYYSSLSGLRHIGVGVVREVGDFGVMKPISTPRDTLVKIIWASHFIFALCSF